MTDALELFKEAMLESGMQPPDDVQADGLLHRFSPEGRRGDDAGWYVFHLDGVPAGAFGNWRDGLTQTWCGKSGDTMTPAEREANRQRTKIMQDQREADLLERQRSAAEAAQARWSKAQPATNHPYLKVKGIQAYGARLEGDSLMIPMRDSNGTLHGLQTIAPNGSKRFMPGGRVAGCYFSIGRPRGVLIVCEGFATGASIHEATGQGVAVALNAGNLQAVAQALREKYPTLAIVLAADDDWRTSGNPGLTKATEAARAVGGTLTVPSFPADRPEKATDFNDLHQLAGLDAVRQGIEGAKLCEPVATEWPEPTPLPDGLPPVAPFDPELLPEALRGWVSDIAHRMQCPPDFPAVGAIAALSSIVGARAVVAPKAKDDWRVVPNLWGLIVGRPGVMKSPALSEVLKPLATLEMRERDRWQVDHAAWELDNKVSELAAKANEKRATSLAIKDPHQARALLAPLDLPPEPIARRYVVNDATVERLGELLAENPWGTLSYRDEIHGLLTAMDRQGQEGARSFYLTAYDGNQGYTFDRVIRGTTRVERVCLAMLGGIQPGKVQNYVRDAVGGGGGDDGLLQRFGLTVWPDVTREFKYVDKWPDTPAKQAAYAVFERLNSLTPGTDDEPAEWRFSPEAQVLFAEWLTPFETEIRGDDLHPALVSHLAKYRKLVPALALLFALIDTPDGGDLIQSRELMRALAWAEYLRSHAERLYAAAVMPETTGARMLLDKIKAGKLADSEGLLLASFTPREVAVKHWAGLATPDAVRKTAEVLADFGYLILDAKPAGSAGGRPSERYLLHPALIGGRK